MYGCKRLGGISFFRNSKNDVEKFLRQELAENLTKITLLTEEIESKHNTIAYMQRENHRMKAQYDLERDRTRALDETNAALRAELSRFTHLANQVAENVVCRDISQTRENERLTKNNNELKVLTTQQKSKIEHLEKRIQLVCLLEYWQVKEENERLSKECADSSLRVPQIVNKRDDKV
ncbi:CDK5 regulatory subunit-associated protein 2-like [Octopus sinensis]|uniref:CDK5 regulatory subunit-associated protein 2-like n=1 Tax=Octopus sinensis TaxID=2607531 RepID=A0A7E6EII4_9MOLL|nr:CDK5 regulatory subunit-associated protein 2-like [Octopus sinensis]